MTGTLPRRTPPEDLQGPGQSRARLAFPSRLAAFADGAAQRGHFVELLKGQHRAQREIERVVDSLESLGASAPNRSTHLFVHSREFAVLSPFPLPVGRPD